MTTAKKLLTAGDLLAMPDDGMRRELVRGELIEMPPAGDNHGFVGSELSWRISAFVNQRGLGKGRMAETGFWIQRQPDTVRAPDYAYISYQRMSRRPQSTGFSEVVPDLVVEVVSPNDSPRYVADKIRMWLDVGVRLALALYPSTEEIVAHHEHGKTEHFGVDNTLTCEPVLPGFSCPVTDIFTY